MALLSVIWILATVNRVMAFTNTDETDSGVDQRDGPDWSESLGCEQRDARKEKGLKVRLPTQSDMICGYASLRGTAALRNTKRGSWFIQALSEVFYHSAKDKHVADMLVKVRRETLRHRLSASTYKKQGSYYQHFLPFN
ncbi:UNVERIFIED_CONTAM: hypothetical protein FKN15_016612 [Acipenser sinensis]